MDPSEQDVDLPLAQRARSGDLGAFQQLVERHQKHVYAKALGMLRERDDAEDAAQEVFVRVHKHLAHFKGDASFKTWLGRITTNVCIDALRRRKTGGEHEALDDAKEDGSDAPAGALSVPFGLRADEQLLAAELKAQHDAAVEQVPEKHREIYELREHEELSYEELSERLKIPKGTVMSRLFHARGKVEQLLRGYVGEQATPSAAPRAPEPDPQQVFLRGAMAAALSDALTRLPPKHREVLLLRELSQLSYPQLAEALGVSPELVPARVFDARARFNKLLNEYVQMRLKEPRRERG